MATPSISEREQCFYSTISAIHSLGMPTAFTGDHTLNLINLTAKVTELIQAVHDLDSGGIHINNHATAIVAFCLTELDIMQPGVRMAGVSDTQGCAESAMRAGRPLDSLDLDITPTSERIARLVEAMGQLAPYWEIRENPSPAEFHYRQEALAMLAYQATAALIATNRKP